MDHVILRLGQLRSSTAALLDGLNAAQWSDADVREPSLLPGWTRGHVLTHIARNADAFAGSLAGALRSEIVRMYPGGRDERNAAIEDGAGRPAAELIADVRSAAERLDRVFAAVADADAWDRPCGAAPNAGDCVPKRWQEVEIHRVDLGGDYTPEQWPAEFVQYVLDGVGTTLDERASGSVQVTDAGVIFGSGAAESTVLAPAWAVAAWLTGRGHDGHLDAAPELSPWI